MNSPNGIGRRVEAIKAQCGFAGKSWPYRPLGQISDAEATAVKADHALIQLMHARDRMDFLTLCRSRGLDSLAWHYRAYAHDRIKARLCIRFAGRRLAEAERMLAALQVDETAASLSTMEPLFKILRRMG